MFAIICVRHSNVLGCAQSLLNFEKYALFCFNNYDEKNLTYISMYVRVCNVKLSVSGSYYTINYFNEVDITILTIEALDMM